MRSAWILLLMLGLAVVVAPLALMMFGLGALASYEPAEPTALAEDEPGDPAPAEDAPELATKGTERKADDAPKPSPAAAHIAKLGSDDQAAAQAALAWLREADADGRLSLRDQFDIAMLTGLSKEAEVFRKATFRKLTKEEVDLGPFVDDVLDLAHTKDEETLQRVRWMLARMLSSWRHRRQVEAAEEAGLQAPAHAFAGREARVRALITDGSVNLYVRVQLAERLPWLGKDALALVPSVLELARSTEAATERWRKENGDRSVVHYGGPRFNHGLGDTLAELGPAVIPHVLPLLREKNFTMSHIGRDALSELGAEGETTLLRAMKDPDPIVRRAAAYALNWADDPTAERIAALRVAALEDASEEVRTTAGAALIYQGEAGVPAAAELLRGDDVAVRAAVIDSLEHKRDLIQGELLAALVKRYEDPHEDEVDALLGIIDNAGSALVPATYSILRLLPRYENSGGITSRQDLLASLGDAALPWFMTALESDVDDLHAYAARGLAWAGPLDGDLKKRGQALLRNRPDSPHRLWLAAAVADERDAVSLRVLDEALDKGPWEARHVAATTLGYMEGLGTRYLDRLTTALVQANAQYYDDNDNAPHGMVGMVVDLENVWKEVLARDPAQGFRFLEHEDARVVRGARWVMKDHPGTVAPTALELWPSVSAAHRALYIELLGTHPAFAKVQAVLVEESAHEPRAKPTKHGAPMLATNLVFLRSDDRALRARMATRLAEQVVARNLWAYNALRGSKRKDRGAEAIAALEPFTNASERASRIWVQKLLAHLKDK